MSDNRRLVRISLEIKVPPSISDWDLRHYIDLAIQEHCSLADPFGMVEYEDLLVVKNEIV